LGRRVSDKSRKRSGELGLLGLQLSLEILPSRPPLSGEGGDAPAKAGIEGRKGVYELRTVI